MYQFLTLALFVGLFITQESGPPIFDVYPRTASLTAALGYAGLVLVSLAAAALARWQVDRRGMLAAPAWFLRFSGLLPVAILAVHMAALSMGWLDVLRGQFPAAWLLIDLTILALPIGVMLFHYGSTVWVRQMTRQVYERQHPGPVDSPVERASIADAMVNFIRHHVALVAAPLILVVVWRALVHRLAGPDPSEQTQVVASAATMIGTLAIFVAAPLVIIRVWRTTTLPPGPLRQSLIDLCSAYGVRVAEILVWHTRGAMINAAVLGVLGRFRYILLTDELVHRVDPLQIRAIMAHEVAHIRLRHIPWLIAAAAAILALGSIIGGLFLSLTVPRLIDALHRWPDLHAEALRLTDQEMFVTLTTSVLALVIWVPVFGWVSRRFERQADTFAVEHLAAEAAARDMESDTPARRPLIRHEDADAMVQALLTVAAFGRITLTDRSWRHGSMKWRIDYLRSLPLRAIGAADVHRTVLAIKALTFLFLALLVGAELYLWLRHG